jgi:hypothetical protein
MGIHSNGVWISIQNAMPGNLSASGRTVVEDNKNFHFHG